MPGLCSGSGSGISQSTRAGALQEHLLHPLPPRAPSAGADRGPDLKSLIKDSQKAQKVKG